MHCAVPFPGAFIELDQLRIKLGPFYSKQMGK